MTSLARLVEVHWYSHTHSNRLTNFWNHIKNFVNSIKQQIHFHLQHICSYFLLNFAPPSSSLIIKWNTFPFFSNFFYFFILFYLVMYVNHSVHLTFATFSAFDDELFYFFWHLKHVEFFLFICELKDWIILLFPHSFSFLHYFAFWNVNKSFVRIK